MAIKRKVTVSNGGKSVTINGKQYKSTSPVVRRMQNNPLTSSEKKAGRTITKQIAKVTPKDTTPTRASIIDEPKGSQGGGYSNNTMNKSSASSGSSGASWLDSLTNGIGNLFGGQLQTSLPTPAPTTMPAGPSTENPDMPRYDPPSKDGYRGGYNSPGTTETPGYLKDRVNQIMSEGGMVTYSSPEAQKAAYDKAMTQAKIEILTGVYTPTETVETSYTQPGAGSRAYGADSPVVQRALGGGAIASDEFYVKQGNGYVKYTRGEDGQFTPETSSQNITPGQNDLTLTPEQIQGYYHGQSEGQTDPYQAELDATETERLAILNDEIKRQQDERTAYLDQLKARSEQQIQVEQQNVQREIDQYKKEMASSREDLSTRFAFRGFGKSSKHFEEQAHLENQANQVVGAMMSESQARIAYLRAQATGAGDETLQSLSNNIAQARDNAVQLKEAYAATASDLRLKAMEAGDAAMADFYAQIAERAKGEKVNTDLSDKMGYLVDDYGNPIYDEGGATIQIPPGESALKFISGTKYQPSGTFNPATGEFTPLAGYEGYGASSGGGGGSGLSAEDLDLVSFAVNQVKTGKWTANQGDQYISQKITVNDDRVNALNTFINELSPTTLPPGTQGPTHPGYIEDYNPFPTVNPEGTAPGVIQPYYQGPQDQPPAQGGGAWNWAKKTGGNIWDSLWE